MIRPIGMVAMAGAALRCQRVDRAAVDHRHENGRHLGQDEEHDRRYDPQPGDEVVTRPQEWQQ